jgi:HPt (histidine-containing phosphotransfer) domain-containing protein
MDAAAINVNWLRKTFDDDTVLAELYAMYVDDTTKRLGELRAAFDASDATKCSRIAHAVKGSSGNVGADRMRELAGILEKLDWALDPARPGALVNDLETEFARARAFVDQFMASMAVAK